MKKIPCMISTKDMAYITDIFNWNMNAYNKINFYLESLNDEDVCKEFKKLSKMHLKNCQLMVNVLKECDSNE